MSFKTHPIPLWSSVRLLPVYWSAFRPAQRIKKWINEGYILLSVRCQIIFLKSPKHTNVAFKLNLDFSSKHLNSKTQSQLLKV